MKPVTHHAHTIGHMVGESRGSQIIEDVPPIPKLPPKSEWCDAGNPRITVWCRTCHTRVIAMNTGLCGWCDTPVDGEALERSNQRRQALDEATTIRETALALLRERPTITTNELADALNIAYHRAHFHISQFRRQGIIERTGAKTATGRRPRTVYRLKDAA